jgi:hypothetical protein
MQSDLWGGGKRVGFGVQISKRNADFLIDSSTAGLHSHLLNGKANNVQPNLPLCHFDLFRRFFLGLFFQLRPIFDFHHF